MDDVPDRYLDALRDVYDPCCQEKGISVVDMGLVRSIAVRDGYARVELLRRLGGARSRRGSSPRYATGSPRCPTSATPTSRWSGTRLGPPIACRHPPRAR